MFTIETKNSSSVTDWHDRYAIGIPVVDSRYQHLFFLFNTDNDGFIEYALTKDFPAVFDQLVDYARYQFFAEERWMHFHQYPRLACHEREHTGILTKASGLYNEFCDGVWPLSLEILEVMHMWIKDHVLKSDEEIGDFIAVRQLDDVSHSCAYREKTVDSAQMALHAWRRYSHQTAIAPTSPWKCDGMIPCDGVVPLPECA